MRDFPSEGNFQASRVHVLEVNCNLEDQVATLQPNSRANDNSGHCHSEPSVVDDNDVVDYIADNNGFVSRQQCYDFWVFS